jgi:hypothetical protein
VIRHRLLAPIAAVNSTSPQVGDRLVDSDEDESAEGLIKLLRSRGLGDPVVSVAAPGGTSEERPRRRCRTPPSVLVRTVERVQTIPCLIEVMRKSSIGEASDARRRAAEFSARMEAECRRVPSQSETGQSRRRPAPVTSVTLREEEQSKTSRPTSSDSLSTTPAAAAVAVALRTSA